MENAKIKWIAIIWALFVAVKGQNAVISTNRVTTGATFTMYCNGDVANVPTSANSIVSLNIFRQTGAATDYISLGLYRTSPPVGGNFSLPRPPANANWNYTFVGHDQNPNRNTMKIQIVVNTAQCSDAGSYICQAVYYLDTISDPVTFNTTAQNLTVGAGLSNLDLNYQPQLNQDPNDPNYMQNVGGNNGTFTCSATGPQGVTLNWQQLTWNSNFGEFEIKTLEFSPTPPTSNILPSSAGCVQYSYQSKLMVQINSPVETMFKCIASSNNVDLDSRNYTLAATAGATAAPSTASAGPDVGMIVGIVIGCVVLIAIIIVVIFVVRYRRNRSKDDHYKDNEDQRDSAADNNLSAPPPVVYPYSKPTKGNKEKDEHKISAGETNEGLDNSYDSRDSTTRGPPRYANTEIENPEPPRYETHRGRQNRAYDDEEREKTDRKHRDDSHEDRKHRSRGHNEPSRRRNYSTDDGNVDFGDPNMGTSI